MILIFVSSCVLYFTRDDHLFFLSCGRPWHYFLLYVEKYCIGYHVPHHLYQFNCATTISLIPSLVYCTLQSQNHRVTHLFFFFFNILAIFSTPPQSKHETQTCLGSRDGIAAQIREVSGNKLGIDFFLFVLLNLMLKLWHSTVDLQFCACH